MRNPIALPDGQFACPECGEVYSRRSVAEECCAGKLDRRDEQGGLSERERDQAGQALLMVVEAVAIVAGIIAGVICGLLS